MCAVRTLYDVFMNCQCIVVVLQVKPALACQRFEFYFVSFSHPSPILKYKLCFALYNVQI